MTQTHSDNRQLEIDWPRATQLAMIDRATIPAFRARDGKRVSALAIKAVLRAIDSYGRGSWAWPAQATLCTASGARPRTLCRAVEALQALGLLIVRRRTMGHGRKSGNQYLIVWSELALLDPISQKRTGKYQSATSAYQSATRAYQSATVADCMKRPRNAQETPTPLPHHQPPPNEAAPAAEPSGEGGSSWKEVWGGLLAAGVQHPQGRIRTAMERGETPDSALAALAEYQSGVADGRYSSVGALLYRFDRGTFPPPSDAYRRRRESQKRSASASRWRVEARAAAEQSSLESRRNHRLEQLLGPVLDSLPTDQLADMIQQLPAFLQSDYRRNPAGIARLQLLEMLAHDRSHCQTA